MGKEDVELKGGVLIGYAVYMKQTYEITKKLLCIVNYNKFNWQISVDLKVIAILLGMQQGYAKFWWDSPTRALHNK